MATSGDIIVLPNSGSEREVLLASSKQRLEMLLNILQCTTIIWFKMSIVPKIEKPWVREKKKKKEITALYPYTQWACISEIK